MIHHNLGWDVLTVRTYGVYLDDKKKKKKKKGREGKEGEGGEGRGKDRKGTEGKGAKGGEGKKAIKRDMSLSSKVAPETIFSIV